ncbi:hypothetical protein Poli38472_006014 [Pythium oligandrum]|uniref:SGF29 C-terminal domain-containing protein n=1 Tax=Pythium oligandrum TaxID=41045 RepID=A0A8K1CTX9_PYTOL|nr:hypothetical protein Poli38472_006014 [Pythium oligandrum]|eukprot:TMW68546.1 hypothetical protein Poli38472_006014 [Pythium oligandrum]
MESCASQTALDAFMVTQLIDNGMEPIAKKINRLYAKLQHVQDDEAMRKRYARQLQHMLSLAYRLVVQHRDQLTECIDTIDHDLKRGVLDGSGDVVTPTPTATSSNGRRRGFFDEEILSVGSHVAAKVARSHELWILARVISYNSLTRMYVVEDVDTGEDDDGEGGANGTQTAQAEPERRHHVVPRDQVKDLPADSLETDGWIHYALNQHVMAMYPNTTSFYSAVVRVPNPKGAPYVLVRFDDDADEFGSHAPDRKIPFRFVVPL